MPKLPRRLTKDRSSKPKAKKRKPYLVDTKAIGLSFFGLHGETHSYCVMYRDFYSDGSDQFRHGRSFRVYQSTQDLNGTAEEKRISNLHFISNKYAALQAVSLLHNDFMNLAILKEQEIEEELKKQRAKRK